MSTVSWTGGNEPTPVTRQMIRPALAGAGRNRVVHVGEHDRLGPGHERRGSEHRRRHGDDHVDVGTVVVLNQQRDVGDLPLGVRPADLQVDPLLDALLLQAVEEALHAQVGAFFRREIDKADLVFHHGAGRGAPAGSEQDGHQKSKCSIPCRSHVPESETRQRRECEILAIKSWSWKRHVQPQL